MVPAGLLMVTEEAPDALLAVADERTFGKEHEWRTIRIPQRALVFSVQRHATSIPLRRVTKSDQTGVRAVRGILVV